MNSIRREWRESKVRPLQGNPPHDRLVDRVISSSPKRVCDDPFSATPFRKRHTTPKRSVRVFQACRNLSVRCGRANTKPQGGTVPPPAGRPRAQVVERARRITLSSSSAMSSDRLFLDRVGRHQSPSPLHRHTQITMHFSQPRSKADISTLLGRGHFYFALTAYTNLLTTPSRASLGLHSDPIPTLVSAPRSRVR